MTGTLQHVRRLTTLNIVVLILTNERIPFTPLAKKAQFPQRRGRDYSEEIASAGQRGVVMAPNRKRQAHCDVTTTILLTTRQLIFRVNRSQV